MHFNAKQYLLAASACVLMGAFASCTSSVKEEKVTVVEVTEAAPTAEAPDAPQAEDAVIEWNGTPAISDKPETLTVIDFNATWCGPCRQFAPVFHAVAQKYAGKAVFYSIDVDNNPETANRFGVSSIPNIVVIHPDGRIENAVGYMDEAQLEELINK